MMAGAIFGHHAILGQPTSKVWVDGLIDHIWAAIRVVPDTSAMNRLPPR
jgi:hypothetical protein